MSKPSNNKESVKIQLFDGGLNTKYSVPDVPINASPSLQNVQFSQYGAVETAFGYEKLNDTQIASATIDGLHTYTDVNAALRMLTFCNGTAYRAVGTASAFSAITESTSVYTASVDVNCYTYDGYVWSNNGSARAYKYDGTYWTQAGVSALTSDLGSVVSGAIGSLNGTYTWVLTGVNSATAESDYFELNTTPVAIVSGEAVITGIPVFPSSAGVETKYLYRNTAGVSTVFYRVTALSAAQTSVTDTIADASLAANEAPSTNNVMPSFKYMVEYGGYLFGAGHSDSPTQLRWCVQGAPERWPATNALEVGEKDGYSITGLRVYNNSIYIQKSDGRSSGSIWILYIADAVGTANSTESWFLTKSNSAYGGSSHKAIVPFKGELAFLDATGVRSFNGTQISKNPQESNIGTFVVDTISNEIENKILDLNDEQLNRSAMINYHNKIYLSAPDGSDTTNSALYTYDYSTVSSQGELLGAWSYFTEPAINNFIEYNGNLYGGGYDGYIYRLSKPSLYTYDGSAIDQEFWTAFIYGKDGHHDNDKVWRYLFVELEYTGDYDLDIYCRQDTSESGSKEQVHLLADSSLWGSMVYGVDYWNAGFDRRIYRLSLRMPVSKSIQFGFKQNAANAFFRLYNLKVEYNLRRQR